MVATENTTIINDSTELAKAVIAFRESNDGKSLHATLAKMVYTAFSKQGYNLTKLRREEREDLVSDMVEFALGKLHKKVASPEDRSFEGLRAWNKSAFNFLMISLNYQIMYVYRQKKKRAHLLDRNSHKILLSASPTTREYYDIESSSENLKTQFSNPLDGQVAMLLAQQYSKVDISRELNITLKKVYASIERIKKELSDNIDI